MSKDISITQKLTQNARASLAHAHTIAKSTGATHITPEHMLYSIFLQKGSAGMIILQNTGYTQKLFEDMLFSPEAPEQSKAKTTLPLHPSLSAHFTDAYAIAAQFGYPYVGTEHITHAILHKPTDLIQKMTTKLQKKKPVKKARSDQSPHIPQDVLSQIGQILGHDGLAFLNSPDDENEHIFDHFTINAGERGKDSIFIGNTSVCDRVTTILGRRTKNNPLLVGSPGVGKTALIEHLAHLATTPDAPAHLRGKKILTLDLALLVAGTSFRGEFEQRLKEIVTETINNPDVILFIDEIHTMIGTGNTSGSLDAANILKPALARGEITVIGATTHDEYKKHIEKDAALARRFQKITLEEPSLSEMRTILGGALPLFESHHHVTFSPESIDIVTELSARYITGQYFPDKAFDVIDETAARLRSVRKHRVLEEEIFSAKVKKEEIIEQKNIFLSEHRYDDASNAQKKETFTENNILALEKKLNEKEVSTTLTITCNDIIETISMMTGVPSEIILEQPEKRILRAHKHLSRTVVGQNQAIKTLTETLTKSALGINDPQRPRGSFLFAGSTGTGKTLTAEVLARDIYGSEDALIRIDMSTLGERHAASTLLGAPAGYIGHGEGATLVEKVRRKPYSVILFDEIEKAHPSTLTMLLQILENGSLTDNEGRTADFCHSIIILTSNIGTRPDGATTLGFEAESENKKHFDTALRDTLAPELIARLDHIITYNTLTPTDLQKITRIALKELSLRLKERDVILNVSLPVIAHIAKCAHDTYGNARAVRRIIHDQIDPMVVQEILKNNTEKPLELTASLKNNNIAIN